MDYIYRENFKLAGNALDRFNRLKPSYLLDMMQQVATNQCTSLRLDWDTMASMGLFWAVTRTHVQILRQAAPGSVITVETWPGVTSRVAYPRSTVAYDEEGNELTVEDLMKFAHLLLMLHFYHVFTVQVYSQEVKLKL